MSVPDVLSQSHQNACALVVFSNNVSLPYLRICKRGFRHCFVMLRQNEAGTFWLSCDPLSNYMEIAAHELEPDFDLSEWLSGQGCTVIAASIYHAHKRPAPPMFFTCVEAVKRILGIHKFTIFTPWQLYRHLIKQNEKQHSTQHIGV